ncbi:MAG: hypothetical protein MUP53_00925, partial [Bacteroidales bacterium]|nr:hypothetical protein [Bacteroidales bacterium]
MKGIDLDKYKLAWEEEKSFDTKIVSEFELKKYLNKRSIGIVASFKIGLMIDFILKTILGISFLILIWLYSNHTGIILFCGSIFLLICCLIFLQFRTYRSIPGQKVYSDDIKTFLEKKIRFYRTKYFKSVYIAALSNPLIFIGGLLFYFRFKYSSVRSLEFIDIFVF